MTVRQQLREHVMKRSRGACEFPLCGERATESAHIVSIGMGGKHAAADDPLNALAACFDHARISDQEHGSGGAAQYRQSLLDLLGEIPDYKIGWHVQQALLAHVERLEQWFVN